MVLFRESLSSIVIRGLISLGIVGIFLWAYGQDHIQGVDTSFREKAQAIPSPIAIFNTDLPEGNSAWMTLAFDYQFSTIGAQTASLSWEGENEESSIPNVILIDHPLLKDVGWNKISDGYFSLYQRDAKFSSLEEFWANQKSSDRILTDPALAYSPDLFSYPEQVTSLATEFEIADYDYILTTYQPPKVRNGVRSFSRRIAVPTTLQDDCTDEECTRRMLWKLDIPGTTTDTPFYIGEVHANFISPAQS